jgi:hypothetical protein
MCGTLLDHRIVFKTRKRHRCFGCNRVIPKGTRADKATSAEDGEVYSSYMCLDCAEFQMTPAARGAKEDDGCIYPGCFADESYARFPILEARP